MLADWARKNSDLPDSCACCSNGKGENALVVVVSPLNALISDQLESCQRLKLKAVKMEQELFDNDDKLTEGEEAEVVYVLQTSRDGSVAKPRSMLNKAIFDSWQRSLSSRQRTPEKEPLLAGNFLASFIFDRARVR